MVWMSSLPCEHLYLHWPFCASKCAYCPFTSFAGAEKYFTLYTQALQRELENFSRCNDGKSPIQTIYFGGGTPSLCPQSCLLDIFGTLRDMFTVHEMAEVTLEVNPGSVKKELVSLWKEVGITRVSIGIQSLKESALRELNRYQSREDVANVLSLCCAAYDDVSIDLMLGLPDVSAAEWHAMVNEVVNWPITHISLYILTVHEGTVLYQKVQSGCVLLPGDDEVMDTYAWTCDRLKEAGFDQYEISNFARDGKYSRHNLAYWQRKSYKGFGLSAASFDGKRRMVHGSNLLAYCTASLRDELTYEFEEELTAEQIRIEKIMLGLRSSVGVCRDEICDYVIDEERARLVRHIDELCQHGFIEEIDGRLRLTVRGMAVENSVAARLA